MEVDNRSYQPIKAQRIHPTFSVRLTKKLMDSDMELFLTLYERWYPIVEYSWFEALFTAIDGLSL